MAFPCTSYNLLQKSGNRDSILEFVGMLNSSSEAVVVTEQGVANKTRAANVMKNSRVGEMAREPNTRNASCSVVPSRQ